MCLKVIRQTFFKRGEDFSKALEQKTLKTSVITIYILAKTKIHPYWKDNMLLKDASFSALIRKMWELFLQSLKKRNETMTATIE